ncbi:MAG: zf-TFIIB domain-containing protein [Thermoplasmata archaeon]|nr:zf-TFIIB domain-containing protein [Thermoplasmata archaeon]
MASRRKKGDSPIDCPRCAVPLWLEIVDALGPDVEIDLCHRCGGSWYDKGELAVRLEDSHIRTRLTNFPEVGEDSQIACPRCGGKMKLRHEGTVEVDFCTECRGVWLDLGEGDALKYQMDWDRHTDTEDRVKTPAIIAVLGNQYI